jgi:lysophospholipase L1-like esterase
VNTPRVLLIPLLLALRAFAADLSAPVTIPAAVAIPRPSEAELTQAKESLARYLNQADAATKALVAKYPDLVAVRPPRVNPCTTPFLAPNFRARHESFVALAKQGGGEVLFAGDSITDWWRREGQGENPAMSGKAVFDKNFGHLKVVNFGIAGDTTQGVLYRLRDGEGQGFQPKAVMLMIGTNSAGNSSSAEIAEGIGAVVAELRQDFPAAKILLLGIFPRGDPGTAIRKTVMDVNPIIAKLHDGKNVFYLDIGQKFLAADGSIAPDIMSDKLHPTQKGYEIWAEAVKQPLADLLK